jgi:hypothetical protein
MTRLETHPDGSPHRLRGDHAFASDPRFDHVETEVRPDEPLVAALIRHSDRIAEERARLATATTEQEHA